ncbi:MAG: DCC1-like thiol-disulfide oxidoreductase family protein [Pseudomonadota bacterium]
MHDTRPMTVYWDRSCSICRAEIEALNLTAHGFELSDCSAPGFTDEHAEACGITADDMLQSLHICDADGVWYNGVDAFEIIYRRAGHTTIANWLARPGLRPLHDRLYATLVRQRGWMARLGLARPWSWLIKRLQARHAAQNANSTP